MEISPLQSSTQPLTSTESTAQPPVNEQEELAQETDLNTESTVTLSSEAQNLSSSTETDSESTVNTEAEAEAAVTQFQQDAANDPVSTEEAQSSNLTSEVVSRLIG